MTKVAFLGHIISAGGVSVDPSKVKDVVNWMPPTSVSEIRSFLRLVGYYRCFIKDFSKVPKPMMRLVEKTSFDELKKRLTSAPLLILPDVTQTFDI
jgi:hypothetical protein